MSKIAKFLIVTFIGIASIISIFNYSPTFAAKCSNVCDSSCKVTADVKKAAGCSGNKNELQKNITNILNGVIGVAGIVAAVFVVVGGIQYMTSTGDASKVEKAKKTILYALIGLIICALAFAIVNFVITDVIG